MSHTEENCPETSNHPPASAQAFLAEALADQEGRALVQAIHDRKMNP